MASPILDNKVIEKLGKDAYDAILNEVRPANIDAQQMTDIARMLLKYESVQYFLRQIFLCDSEKGYFKSGKIKNRNRPILTFIW